MSPPKKYIKVNGVMKKNPEYTRWETAQNGGTTPSSLANPSVALPVISSMDDHMQLNEDLGQEIPLAESTNATIEMMQEPEISLEAGMQPDVMVDALGAVLGKYEVPMGLMNKVSAGCWCGEWRILAWRSVDSFFVSCIKFLNPLFVVL